MSVIPFPCAKTGTASKNSKRTSAWRRSERTTPAQQDIQHRIETTNDVFDVDPADITHLTEGAANTSNADPVVISGRAELTLRSLIARFGFERLPMTFGELYGLLDYCSNLQFAAFPCPLPDEELRSWQASARKVLAERYPAELRAFDLLAVGDIESLRLLHRHEQTLERLGREYVLD